MPSIPKRMRSAPAQQKAAASPHKSRTAKRRKRGREHRSPIPEPVKTDSQALTEWNRLHSPLLRLPGEIRNWIYKYIFSGNLVLPSYAGWESAPLDQPGHLSWSNWKTMRALTLVSRDWYTETRLLPYSCNALWIGDSKDCSNCFHNLKDDVRSAIETVKCGDRFGFGKFVDRYGLISGTNRLLPNIKKVVFMVRQRADDVKLAKHRGCRLRREAKLEAFGRAQGWVTVFEAKY